MLKTTRHIVQLLKHACLCFLNIKYNTLQGGKFAPIFKELYECYY